VSAIRLLAVVLLSAAPWAARPEAPEEARPPAIGVQLSAGAPDGLSAGVALVPNLPWLRLHAGLAWNTFAFGLQGGATVIPLRAPVRPTLTLLAGTYFGADLSSPLSGVNVPDALRPSLRDAGYRFVAGQVGFEVGNPDRFVFFLRAGLSHVWSTLAGIDDPVNRIQTSELRLGVNTVPIVTLGTVIYVW
jgi:hypothetical protein